MTLAPLLLLALRLALPDVANDRCLMHEFGQLLERGGEHDGRIEAAAFLVRERDESWTLIPWPATNLELEQSFTGAIPEGTIAIVHTHPFQKVRPSAHDLVESKRLGLPIYVISFWQIWVADVSGRGSPITPRREWSRGTTRECVTRADLRRR